MESHQDLITGSDEETLKNTFGNQMWRMNNLYKIKTKDGPVDIFRMQPMQMEMYKNRWWKNIVLKVRQIGSSTLWCVFILDSILFSEHPINAGIIAQDRRKAKGLLGKCKFAFDRMNPYVKEAFGLTMSGGGENLVFGNATCKGSTLSSGISMRSDTIHILLISEMGKLAAQYPAKAQEVITGSLPSIPSNGMLIIESTAEGHDGMFFDMVENAAEINDNPRRQIGQRDMKLHFFPWHDREEYADEEPYDLTEEHKRYFDKLRMRGLLLTNKQKYWWARNYDVFKGSMASEYPSYREEAFQAGNGGLYLAKEMLAAEEAGQVGDCRHNPELPCVTAWDLGSNTAIWIYQYQAGGLDRIYLDFIQGVGADFKYYAGRLQTLADNKGYRYGAHVFPWDGAKMCGMTDTYKAFAEDAGLINVDVIEQGVAHDLQVRLAQQMLAHSFFDLEGTMEGRKCIMGYRRRFDTRIGEWANEPVKNVASHGAEAFMVSCMYKPTALFMPDSTGVGTPPSGSGNMKKRSLIADALGLKTNSEQNAVSKKQASNSGWLSRFGFGRSS